MSVPWFGWWAVGGRVLRFLGRGELGTGARRLWSLLLVLGAAGRGRPVWAAMQQPPSPFPDDSAPRLTPRPRPDWPPRTLAWGLFHLTGCA